MAQRTVNERKIGRWVMKGDRTFGIIKVIGLDSQARPGEIQRVRGLERGREREIEREKERKRQRREKRTRGDRGEISNNETPSLTRSLNFRSDFCKARESLWLISGYRESSVVCHYL